MVIISLLSGISFTVYLFLALYILIINPKSPRNRNFFYFCICFALWALSAFLRAYNNELLNSNIIIKIQYSAALVYEIFILRFFILQTESIKSRGKRGFALFVSWIIPAVFLYHNLKFNSIYNSYPDGFWFTGLHILANTYNAIGIVLLVLWSGKSKLHKVKKMVKIIVISGVITILITIIGDYTASFFNLPTPTPFLTLLWIFSIFFVIKKYRMIEISPYTVPIEIMNSMEDIIALFNPERSLLWFNKTDDDVFKKILLKRKNLLSIFSDNFNTVSMISELKNAEKQSAAFRYPCRMNNDIYLYDIVIKNLYDSFGDNMGFLMKAKRIKSVEFLSSMYRITKRELEVIKLLITGLTYQDLSVNLNISENTLKTHISSLYGKLGINNKVELINLVNNLENL